MGRLSKLLAGLERAATIIEDSILVIILTSMILLAAGQIVMRNFLDFGFFWTDELLRLLVLWIAVAGAVAASRSDRHISVDILTRFLAGRALCAAKVVTHAFSAVVCGFVAWHGLAFVRTSHEFGDVLLGNVPAWIPQSVVPIGFALMTWRFLVFTVRETVLLVKGERPE